MTTSAMIDEVSDADLWQSVRQGSVSAFETVVQRHQSLVSATAYNACGDLALSEDVAQEAFWAAWRDRASLLDPGRLRSWLCGIARNLGHNARRRAARSVPAAGLDAAEQTPALDKGPVEQAVAHEQEALVWQSLAEIPESYREPLILYYREDQSVAQVAAALDLSEDAVKQRLARGRNMLQEQIARVVETALQRSRPGRGFTVAVIAGVASLSVGTKSALAGAGGVGAGVGAGVASGVIGAILGPILGLLGGWLGAWLPAQVAETKPQRQDLLRRL